MKPIGYNPQKVLISLLEIEKSLETVIQENCPDRSISLNEDLDKALNVLLDGQSSEIDKVEFLTTQISLLHLKREVDKTIKVVVETNELRALMDYSKYSHEVLKSSPEKINRWRRIDYILLIILCVNFIFIVFAVFYLI